MSQLEDEYECALGDGQVTTGMPTGDHSERSPKLIPIVDIPDGGACEVEALVDGVEESVILLRSGERAMAFLNVCPHAGRRLDWAPGQFLIDQGRLVCAVHGASFERMTGLCVGGPCRGNSLRSIAVVERDGWLLLDDPAAATSMAIRTAD
jgi:nitrite reductase/ring-hydroxylating ferredoxin subunit